MVGKLITLVSDLLQPQKNWGCFTRKMISLLTLCGIGYIGTLTYLDIRYAYDEFIPVHEIVETDPHAFQAVKDLMARMQSLHHEIRGIWLYSWPDSSNVEVVHASGESRNPLPVGHFWENDHPEVGKLTMDICTELNRNLPNTACAVVGNNDAWGLVVVVWDDDKPRPPGHVQFVGSIADRISHLLYGKNP